MDKSEIRDFSKAEIIKLVKTVKKQFQRSFVLIREGSDTTIYYYNTKNSANCFVSISNRLLTKYNLNLTEVLK